MFGSVVQWRKPVRENGCGRTTSVDVGSNPARSVHAGVAQWYPGRAAVDNCGRWFKSNLLQLAPVAQVRLKLEERCMKNCKGRWFESTPVHQMADSLKPKYRNKPLRWRFESSSANSRASSSEWWEHQAQSGGRRFNSSLALKISSLSGAKVNGNREELARTNKSWRSPGHSRKSAYLTRCEFESHLIISASSLSG